MRAKLKANRAANANANSNSKGSLFGEAAPNAARTGATTAAAAAGSNNGPDDGNISVSGSSESRARTDRKSFSDAYSLPKVLDLLLLRWYFYNHHRHCYYDKVHQTLVKVAVAAAGGNILFLLHHMSYNLYHH